MRPSSSFIDGTTKVPPKEDYGLRNYLNKLELIAYNWCPEPESNRHGRLSPRDFKSLVSTNFTIRADFGIYLMIRLLKPDVMSDYRSYLIIMKPGLMQPASPRSDRI